MEHLILPEEEDEPHERHPIRNGAVAAAVTLAIVFCLYAAPWLTFAFTAGALSAWRWS